MEASATTSASEEVGALPELDTTLDLLGGPKSESTSSKCAGLLLLLHILQHRKTKEVADRAFERIDEAFLIGLANQSGAGGDPAALNLVVSVSQALASLSETVASDPKLWRVARECLHSVADRATTTGEIAGCEGGLDLALSSLQSLRVVEDERPECPRHLQDAVRIVLASAGGDPGASAARDGATALLRVALSRMSSQRRSLAILNLFNGPSSSSSFERVATALVGSCSSSASGGTAPTSLAPLDAVGALRYWLEPACVAAHFPSPLACAGLLSDLQGCVSDLVLTAGVRAQRDCVRVAANLCEAFGPKWVVTLWNRAQAPHLGPEGRGRTVLGREGFAYLVLLTAKTEISVLLSDALAPSAKVGTDGGTGTLGGAEWTAGERASAHLDACFTAVDQAIECVAHLEEDRIRSPGNEGSAPEEEEEDLQRYFGLLTQIIGIIADYFVEVSRGAKGGEGEDVRDGVRSVDLAATAVLGRYLMEVPEFLLSDKRVPLILDTLASCRAPWDHRASASASSSSQGFGWSYLAPALALACEEGGFTVEVSSETLGVLMEALGALTEETPPGGGPGGDRGRGRYDLMANVLCVLDHVIADRKRCRDFGFLESKACEDGVRGVLGWGEATMEEVGEGEGEGSGREDVVEALIATCALSVAVVETRGVFGSALRVAAHRHLVRVVGPLHRILSSVPGAGGAPSLDHNLLDESTSPQEWSQMVDLLRHLQRSILRHDSS